MHRNRAIDITICLIFIFLINCTSLTHAKTLRKVQINSILIDVEVVTTPEEQSLGLGNRFHLPEDKGMLFLYNDLAPRIFWMKRMYFPIDIIWIQHNKIIHIEPDVPPSTPGTADNKLQLYGKNIVADRVLEVPAGYTHRKKIVIGDVIRFVDSKSVGKKIGHHSRIK